MADLSTTTPATSTTVTETPNSATTDTTIKPGVRTSEFVVTILIILLGSIMGSGLITNNTYIQIAGIAMATLKGMMYTWSRATIKIAAMFLILGLAAHTQTGCASTTGLSDKTLRATLTTTDAARAAYGTLDLAYQERLRTSSTTAEEAQAKVNAYRAGAQTKIRDSFVAVYSAITDYAVYRDDPHLKTLLAVAEELAAQLKLIELPGGK